MNTRLPIKSWLLVAAVIGSVQAPAQETKPPVVKPPVATEATPPATDALIEQLADRSYRARRDAEGALRTRGADALTALRKAATDHPDAEVRWRARRLVAQIEGGEAGALQPRGAPPVQDAPWTSPWRDFGLRGGRDLEDLFGQMFERLEREGVDVPRTRFFGAEFFKDLRQQMDEIQRAAEKGLPGRSQAFSLRVDHDGVRVEVTEKVDNGESKTQVYEAPDLRTFRAKYPEIAERYLRGYGPGAWTMPWPRPLAEGPFRGQQPGVPDAEAGEAGERLGVMVGDVAADVRDFLHLPADVGLQVRAVSGPLAQALGIEAGDILLQVGAQPVCDTDDVRVGLRGVAAGGKVEVKVNRRGAEKVLTASKPAAETKPAPSKGQIR